MDSPRKRARTGRPDDEQPRARRRRRRGSRPCPLCHTEQSMLWSCPCGFEMCQVCMQENLWGVTCNQITWICPDCGRHNSY